MEIKKVGVACDHAGYPLKQYVMQYLEEKGYPVEDFGTNSDISVDYPDYAHALAKGIESGEIYPGIAICGSGEGMTITLN
jgi:ribose 5-phosphate isomerase B